MSDYTITVVENIISLDVSNPEPITITIAEGLVGPRGPIGPKGDKPVKGVDYFDGADGTTPVKGVDYFDGADSTVPGPIGPPGQGLIAGGTAGQLLAKVDSTDYNTHWVDQYGGVPDPSASKTTPIDTDNLLLQDSADSSVWKKLTWANVKATLKTYFDGFYATLLQLAGKRSIHGFENLTDSSLPTPYTGTNVFTLTKVNNFNVWFDSVKTTLSASVSIDVGATAEWTGYSAAQRLGHWFVWMVADGTLRASKSVWDIMNVTTCPVATIHWDGAEWIPANERHGIDRNLRWHKHTHDNYGAAYTNGFTSTPTFASGSTNTFSFTGGTISDEDLPSITTGAQTACRIGYRVSGGASMTWNASGPAYAKVSSGAAQYDNAGTLTNLSGNQYGIYWIYQTNREGATNKITSIVGQAQYASIAAAQAAPLPTLAGLSVAEWKALYRVIVRANGAATTWSFTQADPLYNLSTGPAISAGAATVQHDSTSPQLATSGTTYGHIDDQAQTIAGIKTFSAGIVAPALVSEVTSGDITIATTDNGYVVTYTGSGAINCVLPAVSGFSSNFQVQVFNQASAAVDITFTSQATEYKGAATKIAQYKSAYLVVRNSKWWCAGGLS